MKCGHISFLFSTVARLTQSEIYVFFSLCSNNFCFLLIFLFQFHLAFLGVTTANPPPPPFPALYISSLIISRNLSSSQPPVWVLYLEHPSTNQFTVPPLHTSKYFNLVTLTLQKFNLCFLFDALIPNPVQPHHSKRQSQHLYLLVYLLSFGECSHLYVKAGLITLL